MSVASQVLPSHVQPLAGLSNDDRHASHADDTSSLELQQEAPQQRDSTHAATGTQREQLEGNRCTLYVPLDGAVYRPDVKSGHNCGNIRIKKARFDGGVGETGVRFAVASEEHKVQSESLVCNAVYAGCTLLRVHPSERDPPAFVTLCSVQECAELANHFDVVVSVREGGNVRLLPPAHAFGDVHNGKESVAMMEENDFQFWRRQELASAKFGGWSEEQIHTWR